MDTSSPPFLVAPGRERPDFTAFDFPDATLTDGSTEEIEFDQALSLVGRRGRDFLGLQVGGINRFMKTEFLTIATADHDMDLRVTLATRTGNFVQLDPELIFRKVWGHAVTAPTTATSEAFNPVTNETKYGEPFLYVAPRLFFRANNNLDASLSVGDLDCRFASIGVRLTFRAFIELLERFADVTLL